MGFFDSYKRLDNLCKDIFQSEKGVTTYIDEMKRFDNSGRKNAGWKRDIKKLKHCRHIRNQIAHENNATEENMTTKADTQWIEELYGRILDGKDPLTVYKKARKRKRFLYILYILCILLCILFIAILLLLIKELQ